MDNGPEQALPGGVEPQFIVDVSAAGSTYWSGGRQSSSAELAAALRAAATYSSPQTAILVAVGIVACLVLVTLPLLLIVVVPAGIGLFVWSAARDARRRRVAVRYRLDERAAQAFESLSNGAGWLQNSRAVWRITHEARAQRAETATSIVRTGAAAARGEAANLVTNLRVPTIASAGETLLLMPDALLIRDGAGNVVDVPYSFIRAEVETTRFSETDLVPPDSKRVGSTWLYANKNGSPDRRRANNREIPIVEYARVTLSWPRSGCALLVSNVAAARHFAGGVQEMGRWRQQKPAAAAVPAREVKMLVPSAGPTELERALQASIDQKRRQEALARSTPAPRPQAPAQAKGEWLGQGRSATVHGFATGDFVYVGNRLGALDGSGVEPALIDPSLPVDPAVANTSGAGMSYWPSYGSISASGRRALLEWLAGGRKSPDAYVGYVFLFFYGLERRVYEYVQDRGSSGDEVLAIAGEVARLLDLYARTSGSFASYGGALLDLIATIEPRARDLARDADRTGDGPSQRLKLTLGELSRAGQPIPAALALEWVRSSYSLNTPATRCAEEFELLFHIRYAKQFGAGMVVKPNKTCLDLTYRPASGGLEPLAVTQDRIPDITQLTRPFEKLAALVQECTAALDPFSRFLGKNPEGRHSLSAFALLPEDLVEGTPSTDAASLASLVRSRLDGDGRAHLGAGELLPYVRLAKPEKVAKNEAMLLAQALEKLGYGIEPDVRVGGPVYDADGRVVVFRRLPDCPSTASGEYATATLCMRLGAVVSSADDEVSEAERALLQKHISDTLQLSAGERQRLAAHLAWLLEEKPGTSGLKKQLAALTSDTRHHVGQLLITVATTDGRVDPREMKMLEKLYDLIGLDTATLYADIHAALATDDEPVAVDPPAAAPKGFAIPVRPAPPAATPAGIDMERVRLKIAETRQVSTLLSGIFAEEEAPAAAAAPAVAEANTIGTLDAAHSELLRRLAQRESWPRDEVERLASDLALLPDGALETINDYAYATADEAFWEDDDPVAINSNVAMELIA
ncbi:MAG TPA: TerB N-terminal domain-containing protein [Thermoanaerobaculia bacterium]|nr:TerB N-terminal domain-containing protein [Thermoanaerobaculia bacterium]